MAFNSMLSDPVELGIVETAALGFLDVPVVAVVDADSA